jgi:NitT/TauT family transport system permease protein
MSEVITNRAAESAARSARRASVGLFSSGANYRGFIGIAALLLVWQAASTLGILNELVIPSPSRVLLGLWKWMFDPGPGLYDGKWAASVSTTAVRVFVGFAIAAVAGVVIGILVGYFREVRAVVDPIIQLFRPVPTIAWLPLAVVFFGFTPQASIFLIGYGAFFPIVVNTSAGVLRSQRQFLMVGQMLGANRFEMLRYIVLPAALPSVFTGLRISVGLAWILSIVAEMVAVRSGLGYDLLNSYTVFRYDILIAAMISFAVLGFLSDRLILALESWMLAWRKGYELASASR